MKRAARQLAVLLGAVIVGAGCGSSAATGPKPAATPSTTKAALTARQRAKVCTADDMSVNNVPVPAYRRLTSARSEWFGRVRLDPVPASVQPHVPLNVAWNGFATGPTPTSYEPGFSGAVYGSAIYDVVLAYWTSDETLGGLVVQEHGRPVPHEHVLAWVAIGTHRPVEAHDVDLQRLTVPGVPCYFGVGITAVNATTGKLLADALDYH
jgi:hypothetical protein